MVVMSQHVNRPNYKQFKYGDIVRLTAAVPRSKGKRFKFIGAIFEDDKSEEPLYLDLIEIGRGQMRAIKPEYVVKEVAASKASQARLAKKESKS